MGLYKMNLWQLFVAGGPIMWPILLCSIIAVAIIIAKFSELRAVNIGMRGLLPKILEKLKRQEIKEAVKVCESTVCPLANILKAGVLKYDRPRQQIIETMEDASLYEIPRLEKNLPALSTIANVAPLLGLLGTAVGMVRVFQVIQAKTTSLYAVSAVDLAGGVWEALLTSVAGLLVAIPAFLAYNYLSVRVNQFILEMEKASTELANFLTEQ